MNNDITLSNRLHQQIDNLIQAYEYLKSENKMLRDELQVSKERLQESEKKLLEYSDHSSIKETEISAIIEKLETALGTH